MLRPAEGAMCLTGLLQNRLHRMAKDPEINSSECLDLCIYLPLVPSFTVENRHGNHFEKVSSAVCIMIFPADSINNDI
ncbi:hypothetical protein NPIL_88391 [Nephila pilipes]|uniref:Uncharacterized protein n=1 Tax=Nephila pilipes TaxID=299642 RepID=A0A8X6ISJ5_NEPPI|nr:hypothetical protein NPIL_88391 [Nephila pilipes]